jgi:hypothetical protein
MPIDDVHNVIWDPKSQTYVQILPTNTFEVGPARETMRLAQVILECWQTAEDHGFHEPTQMSGQSRTFGDTCALITSEVSEAYECYRDFSKGGFKERVENGKPEGPGAELADAVIRIFDTAVFDLKMPPTQFAGIILDKMEYNKSRPYKHGRDI